VVISNLARPAPVSGPLPITVNSAMSRGTLGVSVFVCDHNSSGASKVMAISVSPVGGENPQAMTIQKVPAAATSRLFLNGLPLRRDLSILCSSLKERGRKRVTS